MRAVWTTGAPWHRYGGTKKTAFVPRSLLRDLHCEIPILPAAWDTSKGLRYWRPSTLTDAPQWGASVWPQPGRWEALLLWTRAHARNAAFVVLDVENKHWKSKHQGEFRTMVAAFANHHLVGVTSHGRPDLFADFFVPWAKGATLGFPQAYNDGRYNAGFQGRVWSAWRKWYPAPAIVQTLGANTTTAPQMGANLLELWRVKSWSGNLSYWSLESLGYASGGTEIPMLTTRGQVARLGYDLAALRRAGVRP